MKNILAISAVIFTIGFVSIPVVWSDDDHFREYTDYGRDSSGNTAESYTLYKEECGSCHLAYPSFLLPAISWQKIMLGLDNHFGENAELDSATYQSISQFLNDHSADGTRSRRTQKYIRYLNMDNAPLRITQTPFFRHEHHEIPARMVSANPEVSSFSHCDACHRRAQQGRFNEHDVRIPGFGHWDD
jgi:hypothetical protein